MTLPPAEMIEVGVMLVAGIGASVVTSLAQRWAARKKASDTRGKRLYEWRDGTGKRHGEPALQENACAFRVSSMLLGRTNEAPALHGAASNGSSLYLHVTATGERVVTELAPSGAGARLGPDSPWYGAAGQEVKP